MERATYTIVQKLANGEVKTQTREYKDGVEDLKSAIKKDNETLFTKRYNQEEGDRLVIKTMNSLDAGCGDWTLKQSLSTVNEGVFDHISCTDWEYYAKIMQKLENPAIVKHCGVHPIYDTRISKETKTQMIVYELVKWWLHENKHAFGSKGGNWCCGSYSGVWADFCIKVKLEEAVSLEDCTHYYLGVRLVLRDDVVSRITGTHFKVANLEIFDEPTTVGETTVCFANYGEPFVPTIEKQYHKKLAAEEKYREEKAKVFRELAKRVAKEQKKHEVRLENLARQSEEVERKRKARMEAELDETIIAYNAQVQRTKDIIAFNRKHIADPLLKRIEAKEAEQHRIEAERRHDVKMKQKEAERLAKHAKRN
jgi:hypothetical protein